VYVIEVLVRRAEAAGCHLLLRHMRVACLDHGRLLLRLEHVHLSSFGDGGQAGHPSLLDVLLDCSLISRVYEDTLLRSWFGCVNLGVLASHLVSNEVAMVPLVAR